MTNQLAIYENFSQIESAAKALQTSGYFSDVKSQAQAVVKVMAGAELGLPPFASMSGIHIVQGKPVLGSNVIATLVKNDPRYDYRIKQCDATACVIEWFEGGQSVGFSEFTMKEANDGNVNKTWDKQSNSWKQKATWKAYPSDMLFARAISRGARRFAPGIFGGAPVYTPDEMNVETDVDGYVSVEEVQPESAHPEPVTDAVFEEVQKPSDKIGRFADEQSIKVAIDKKRAYHEKQETPVSSGLIGLTVGTLDTLCGGENQRHRFCKFVCGKGSSKDIDDYYFPAIMDWAKDETNAKIEAAAIVRYIDGMNALGLDFDQENN